MTPANATLAALQDALASQHALVHAYGVLGARSSQSTTPDLYDALRAALREHRSRRDALEGFVVAAGGRPGAAAPAYAVPDNWNSPAQIRAAALELERSATASMAALVGGSTDDVRAWALLALEGSATRELELGGSFSAWPGAPELQA